MWGGEPHKYVDLEGDHVRFRALIGPMSKQGFLAAASDFLGSKAITLGVLVSYGSWRDYNLAGPGPVGDHCGYRLWRSMFDDYRPAQTGCVAVQEAVKVGSAILYRSLDGKCRRISELVQGQASPLDLLVDGNHLEILEMHFHRPIGKENLRHVGADLFVRTNGHVTVSLAKAVVARLEAVTGAPDIDVILRPDSWFFDVCGFPAVYPFEDMAKVPSEEEFHRTRYIACGLFAPSSIRCIEPKNQTDP
jgi:hypothetical protein